MNTETPKIKWESPKKILGSTLYKMLPSTGEMMDDFVRHGLIEKSLTGNYSLDVTDMCRNGATWLGAHMSNLISDVQVVEGTFLGTSHCWVVVEDYYFDTTIAQMNKEYPEFACVRKDNAKGYSEFMRFPVRKWLEMHLDK